ncbi:MAG: alpha/beta hydrolase [Pseudomonadota bacterium]
MALSRLAFASAIGVSTFLLGVASIDAASANDRTSGDGLIQANVETDTVQFKSMEIDGLTVAYREAGDPSRPTILLLHGFPTSSHMFRELMPILAKKYHVLAPDYPGYGASDMPAMSDFEYSFASLAATMDKFVEAKGVNTFTLYAMDYGAPVGYRMFNDAPERVSGLIIQNGNAYEEGLETFWDPFKVFWANPTDENAEPLRAFLEYDAQVWQYTHGVPEAALSLVSPDNWHHDQFLLDRDGAKDIQVQLFKSYGTNVPEYANWQEKFRKHQPPALIVWGKNDHIFPPAGAYPYLRDLEDVEMHMLDAGHFVLETHLDFVADEILDFMAREVSA